MRAVRWGRRVWRRSAGVCEESGKPPAQQMHEAEVVAPSDVAPSVERLFSVHEALGWILSTWWRTLGILALGR